MTQRSLALCGMVAPILFVFTAILSAGLFAATMGSPFMGLTERIAALVGFLWTFTLALWMYREAEIQ
jgi:hypothetical protein